jgi:CspA family cold shock protein
MFLRALVTSFLLALIYTFLTTPLGIMFLAGELQANSMVLSNYLVFWSLGFLSILSFVYGRKIKRNFRGETGTIKWFDPSKGYGFLIRDKGGDLFVHLRAVQSSDRRKLRENTRVRFSVEDSEKGPQAENIKII